jgi:predicted nucleotidyltransferase component of viral defense system
VIPARVIRRIARERGLALDIVEKDYLLGWMLFCISRTNISDSLAFKGGSALSKVYFPLDWRLSEDLDFTLLTDEEMPSVAEKLAEEIPGIGEEVIPDAGLRFPRKPFANPGLVRGRLRYTGPVGPNNVKIEITMEEHVGTILKREVPRSYEDYPEFRVNVYSLETILAEKIRSLLERERVRDWYDVWRLLKVVGDARTVTDELRGKLEGKRMECSDIEEFFPEGLDNRLEPHWKIGLVRLTSEELPSMDRLLSETRDGLMDVLSMM